MPKSPQKPLPEVDVAAMFSLSKEGKQGNRFPDVWWMVEIGKLTSAAHVWWYIVEVGRFSCCGPLWSLVVVHGFLLLSLVVVHGFLPLSAPLFW